MWERECSDVITSGNLKWVTPNYQGVWSVMDPKSSDKDLMKYAQRRKTLGRSHVQTDILVARVWRSHV